jgi:hypothetical protein
MASRRAPAQGRGDDADLTVPRLGYSVTAMPMPATRVRISNKANPFWSCTKRAIDRSRDLLARAGIDRARQRNAPAVGSACGAPQPQIREDHGLIDVNGDLFGAALGGDMLGARQRCPAPVTGQPDEIARYQRYRAPRALLPGRVSRRINDNLADHSPTRMVRIAPRNEKPGQRVGDPHSFRLRPVSIQVPQCGTHVPAALHRAGELPRRPPRLASFIVDLFTVLGPESFDEPARARTRCGSRRGGGPRPAVRGSAGQRRSRARIGLGCRRR